MWVCVYIYIYIYLYMPIPILYNRCSGDIYIVLVAWYRTSEHNSRIYTRRTPHTVPACSPACFSCILRS
uniref:Putative secreted protein n=1 Tax=Anopheles darlingi TaxID=43151 RepID=A0A2M4D536_ANODA